MATVLTCLLISVFSSINQPASQAKPQSVWIEGEQPVAVPSIYQSAGWGRSQDLAAGKWLFTNVEQGKAEKLSERERLLEYTVRLPATANRGPGGDRAQRWNVWLRVGYEFARSPFRWRIGTADWNMVTPDDLTTDLMAIADFAEIAWLNVGTVELNLGAGVYTLQVEPLAEPGKRLLFAIDAIHITDGVFQPNGPHRPGALWKTPLDYEAEKAKFSFPSVPKETPPQARRDIELNGTWQIARYDEQTIEGRTEPIAGLPVGVDQLFWRGIQVPGHRDDLLPAWTYAHRYLYRTRIEIPAELAGRSLVLRFPNNALMTTVWVNRKPVGFSRTPCAPFECDITAAATPGQVNELIVGIKDHHYALAKSSDGRSTRYSFSIPPQRLHDSGGLGAAKFADFPTIFKVRRHGILETPTLSARGLVYTDDVFVQTDTDTKQITLQTSLSNPTDNPLTVRIEQEIRALQADGSVAAGDAKPLPAQVLTVAANSTNTSRLTEAWPNARLWWPDDPFRYVVLTTVVYDDKKIDTMQTPFGFRTWGIRGRDFTLNGIPWRFRADLRGERKTTYEELPNVLAEWRRNGQNMMRFWGDQPWVGSSQAETLTALDRAGVPVRRSGIFDGEVASYQLVSDGQVNKALFEHWREQLAAWIKAERNHPSIFIWSLENEVTYINARNFGWLKQVEPEIQKAAELVQALDPTRPVMIDGGNALLDASLPVVGNHYLEEPFREYPQEAYTLELAKTALARGKTKSPWPVPEDRPLFLGESFFANGTAPAAYAELIGEAAFLGRRTASQGVTRFARMLSEGYRTYGVAAFHFWFAEAPDAEHYKAWQPLAVFTREWDSAWPAGQNFNRTLTVLNDTRHSSPITVHWLLQTKKTPTTNIISRRGKTELKLAPGEHTTVSVELELPMVPPGETIEADWVVAAVREGKEVFRDAKTVRLLGPLPKLESATRNEAPSGVILYDPAKQFPPRLRDVVSFTEVQSLAAIPPQSRLIIVGPNALSAEEAMKPTLAAFAASGAKVLVFDQTYPLQFRGLPLDLEPFPVRGRVAFPVDLTHPTMRGLVENDFFCWSGDQVCYRTPYRKPSRAAKTLLSCDEELGYAALLEVPVGKGAMWLNQTCLSEKPDDPAALRLAYNLLQHAVNFEQPKKTLAVLLPADDPRRALLDRLGANFTTTTDLSAALAQFDLIVLDGTLEQLANYAALPTDARSAFVARGGQVILWNLVPEALEPFQKLVGVPHLLRPFRRERIVPAARPSPLAAGLSIRDLALESAEKIYPWAADRYPADDTFTYVVDLEDVAPFVTSDRYDYAWKQMTNGLTSADSWKFIFYHNFAEQGENPIWTAKLGQPEIPAEIEIVLNTDYQTMTQLRVIFDDDPQKSQILKLKPEAETRQRFALNVTAPVERIGLQPLAWTKGNRPIVGIDNLRLLVRRPDEVRAKVRPWFEPGGLVDYPQTGIVLNQLKIQTQEQNPINAEKKAAVVVHLLSKLGAEFRTSASNPANQKFTTVPFEDRCNAYLASGKARPGGVPDLSFLPVGSVRHNDIPYEIRDFRTSPLPSAIMVDQKANAVSVPVNAKAEALYFLHTYHAKWVDPNRSYQVGFEYVIQFAQGEPVVLPIQFGRQVGSVSVDDPSELRSLPVAWAAKFPNTEKQAVLYSFRWLNSRPGETIQSVTIRQSRDQSNRGVPIWLGLTLGQTP